MGSEAQCSTTHASLCTTCLSSVRSARPLRSDSLSLTYCALLSINLSEIDRVRVCWECEALLRRCLLFRRRAERAHIMLQQHAMQQDTVISSLSTLCTSTRRGFDSRLRHRPPAPGDVGEVKLEPEVVLTVKHESDAVCDDSDDSRNSENKPLVAMATRKAASGIVDEDADEKDSEARGPSVCVRMMKQPAMLERREQLRLEPAYSDAPHACDACILGFSTPEEHAAHVQLLHTPRADHMQCSVCEAYVERVLLEVHVRRHYATFACTHCAYTHHLEQQVEWHTKTCEGRALESASAAPDAAQYPCEQCSKVFKSRAYMKAHVVRQHSGPRACGRCGKVLPTTQALWLHMQMEHKDRDMKPCPVCGKLLPGAFRLKQHMRVHKADPRGVAPHRCEPCDKIFMSERAYNIHLTSTARHNTESELKFKCSACERAFAFKGALYSHFSHYHKKATRLQCELCNRVLATSASLKRHNERVHEGVREKKDRMCDVCGKYFSATQLKQHMLIHTEERPYACAVCGATFRQRPALYTHNRLVHLNVRRARAPPRPDRFQAC